MTGGNAVAGSVRHLLPEELSIAPDGDASPQGVRLRDRPVIVMVGLTGAGKTTTLRRLEAFLPIAAVLPDRRAMTDRMILPMMTGSAAPVTDRVERFRLTAAFKERHPGGMGDLLSRVLLPGDLRPGPVLFDGLRGEAEVSAAAALESARFLVLDCSPEGRLRRLCGRDDPFDRTAAEPAPAAFADGVGGLRRVLAESGFEALTGPDAAGRLAAELAAQGADPAEVGRMAAIIVEESRHYDPAAARAALQRLAPGRTLVIDTDRLASDQVADAAVAWSAAA